MSLHEMKMAEARAKVLFKAPYFSSVVYAFVFTPCPGIKTMLVTPKLILGYDPQWAEAATPDWLAADICHEVFHFVNRHFERLLRADPKLKNLAGDLAINPFLRDGGWNLHESSIFPKHFNLPEGKSMEEYYELLLQKQQELGQAPRPQRGSGPSAGTGEGQEAADGVCAGHCGGLAGNSHNKDIEEELDAEPGLGRSEPEVKAVVARAAAEMRAHQGRGNLPQNLVSLLEVFDQPSVVRWEDELANILQDATGRVQAGGSDYSLARPSKRSLVYGCIRPGMVEYLPEVAIIRDSSGSMGAEQLTSACREAHAILLALGIDEVWFSDADTNIARSWQRVGGDFFRELKDAHGRGGTDFIKPLESATQLSPQPDLIVYLTDGDGAAPAGPPEGITVVWGIVPGSYSRRAAPWGHTVVISDDPKARTRILGESEYIIGVDPAADDPEDYDDYADHDP